MPCVAALFGLVLGGVIVAGPTGAAEEPNGALLAWGHNFDGELGAGPGVADPGSAPVPVAALPGGAVPVAVSAGYDNAAALGSDGAVYGWGRNTYGEIGNESDADHPSTVPLRVSGLPATTKIVQLSAGGNFDLALTADGRVFGWGDDGNGQLGSSDSEFPGDVSHAIPVTGFPAGTTITSVTAGGDTAFAITSTGQLYSWGDGVSGTLGDGSTPQISRTPQLVNTFPAGTTIREVSAQGYHVVALTSTGRVFEWGNDFTEFPHPTSDYQATTPQPITGFPAGEAIVQVVAGGQHSLALTSVGSVFAWGRGVEGQLGDGSYDATPTPTQVLDLPAVTAITAGELSSAALTSAGGVYTWGDGADGELGDGPSPTSGPNQTSDVAVPVTGLAPTSPVQSISANGFDVFALSTDSAAAPEPSASPVIPSGPPSTDPTQAPPSGDPTLPNPAPTAAPSTTVAAPLPPCITPATVKNESAATARTQLATAHCQAAHDLDTPAGYSTHKHYAVTGYAIETIATQRSHGKARTTRTFRRLSPGTVRPAGAALALILTQTR
jgi:alpha-tubulin suppressor-like RCC1 family protein